MGKHFDSLVELVKKDDFQPIVTDGKVVKEKPTTYLESLLTRSELFEFDINVLELPSSRVSKEEQVEQRKSFLDLSEQYGKSLLMPFNRPSAIEDPESVVIFDPQPEKGKYKIVLSNNAHRETRRDTSNAGVFIYDVEFDFTKPESENSLGQAKTQILHAFAKLIKQQPTETELALFRRSMYFDLGNAINAYIQQLAYINDPTNFILRREGKALHLQKRAGKKIKIPQPAKTWNRVSYLVMTRQQTMEFLRANTTNGMPLHLVNGYVRRLTSPTYTNARGTVQYIAQHCKGQMQDVYGGEYVYTLMIKTSATHIEPVAKNASEANGKHFAKALKPVESR